MAAPLPMSLRAALAPCMALALLAASCGAPPPEAPPAPPATVTLGGTADVAAQAAAARGKVLVVNLWATWCPPCVAEMPYFVRFYNEMDRATTAFVSVSLDDPNALDRYAAKFHREKALPFPVTVMRDRDPDALGAALGAPFSGALPVTLVYAKDGRLAKAIEGETDYDGLMTIVKPLL